MKIIRVRAMFSISLLLVIVVSIFSMLPSVFGTSPDREDMIVEANVFAPVVKIEVPNYVFLGNVTRGFSSDRVRIDINNTGTTAVSITPELENTNENIFKYLTFARRTTEQFVKIGDFTLHIDRPSDLGKIESDYFYMKLDLTDYSDNIPNDLIGHRSKVVFWAVAE